MSSNVIEDAVKAGRSLAYVATVLDLHGHGGPWCEFWSPANDPAAMVRVLDRLGVQAIVLAPHLAIGPDPDAGNEMIIDWSRRFPGRLLGYASVYPHEPETVRDRLNRAFDRGLVAVKVHPSCHRHPIGGPGYRAIWEVARERRSFVLSHTWHGDPTCGPGLFAPLAEEYPEVPIILGHSGGMPAGFAESIALARRYPNLYLDTCGSRVTGEWIRRMVAEVGADRVVYGSDLPFIDIRYCLGKAALSGLADDQLRLVMGLNAKRLLAAVQAGTSREDCA